MLSSVSLDQVHSQIRDRIAEAEHEALVHAATRAASHSAPHLPLRLRMARLLRTLACRLDSSLALPA